MSVKTRFFGKKTKPDHFGSSFFRSCPVNMDENITTHLARTLCDRISDREYFRPLIEAVGRHDYVSIAQYQFDYTHEQSVVDYAAARQLVALFNKNRRLPGCSDSQRRSLARDKFYWSELECKRVNDAIENNTFSTYDGGDFEQVLYLCRRKISDILGDVPRLADLNVTFGPGATTSVQKNTNAFAKLGSFPTCSQEMLSCIREIVDDIPLFFLEHNYVRVESGSLLFVPKDAFIDRVIMPQPTLNTLYQLGIGKHIRNRLKRFGIDLRDQTINRNRARIGSTQCDDDQKRLCTLDLSSASDCIPRNLVLDLLPLSWVDLLNKFRCGIIEDEGRTFELEKFSSMGNGYTFELESLIFYSLAYAIIQSKAHDPRDCEDLTVYGDDIICQSRYFERIQSIFLKCGFTVNAKKSFANGPFRESCGHDYLYGRNIRPFYVKDSWTPARVVGFLNYDRANWAFLSDDDRNYLLNFIRQVSFVPLGPSGLGDGHLHVDDPVYTPYKRDSGYHGYRFKTFVKIAHCGPPRWLRDKGKGAALLPYYNAMVSSHKSSKLCDYHLNSRVRLDKSYIRGLAEEFSDLSLSNIDPYSLRGGEKCRLAPIYVWSK